MITYCVKNGVVIGVILLFIGIAVQPSIATVQPDGVNVEYYGVKTEFIGLDKEYITQLTKEEIEELDVLFDSINERLNQSTSMNESVNIFKDAVLKLDSYGLFGDVGVDEIEKLVTNYYQNSKLMETLERLYNRGKRILSEDENRFCLIFGVSYAISSNLFFYSHIAYLSAFLLMLLVPFAWPFSEFFMVLMFAYFTIKNPFCLGRMILFPSNGDLGKIISFGLNGLKYWNGRLKGLIGDYEGAGIGVLGFTGLKIEVVTRPYQYYFGFALKVHIEDS